MAGIVAAVVVPLLIWVIYRLLRVGRRPNGYPPGPPTTPIFGNILQMPLNDPHLQFQKWAKEYGPVFSLILGTKVMIVLSTDQAVKDLMDKKSAIYSSRPDLYISQTIMSGGQRMLITPYGPMYRLQRRLCQNALNIKKATSYIPYQDLETKQLLFDMMENPSGLFKHFRRFASSVATSVVYGFRWKTFDDAGLQLFFHNLDIFTEIMSAGGAALADSYPFLRYLPASLYPIKRKAREHHEVEKKMYKGFYLKAKNAIVEKSPAARACACGDIVEMQQTEGFSDDFAMYVAGTIFEAGSETTASELYGFAQAMLLYPDIQRKAQAEIDALMGEERWPTMDDEPHLPYVRACVKETLRWMPTLILGAAPHALMENDQYMGYHLPAGAMVMLNVWTIHRDAERYARPETFSPDRYLGDETSSAESCSLSDVSKRDHFSFGAGRRVCPGTHVSDRSMFLVMARVLWAFDIKPKQGGRVSKQDEFVQAMSVAPKPFDVEITPRSAKRGEAVKREWSEAQLGLDEQGQFLKNPI